MRIRGILKDDIRTRAKLVEKPAAELDLLVHVLFTQGRPIELVWERGSISGDPALVMYVERCAEMRRVVPVEPDGALIVVTLDDWETIASCVRELMEANSLEIENGDEEFIPAPI